jgi:hypothetical protein
VTAASAAGIAVDAAPRVPRRGALKKMQKMQERPMRLASVVSSTVRIGPIRSYCAAARPT